jgi:hypothetical protein
MTLLVFFGVVVSLLILRLIPGLLMRLVLAIPRQRLIAMMCQLKSRRVSIVLPRKSSPPEPGTQLVFWPAPSPRRGKLVYVSSSLLALAVLVTTAFWTWHATGLMMFLR